MRPELESLLVQRYPQLFAQSGLPPEESGMAWGCQCGDGWFDLLDTLCECLQGWSDMCGTPPVVLTQVKEKFGELRVYQRGAGPEQRGMIEMARALSARLCQTCGQVVRRGPGDAVAGSRCPACRGMLA